MKSTKVFRSKTDNFDAENLLKKGAKLTPVNKNGKEKRSFYKELDDEEDDVDLNNLKKRDSILNYFDDGEDDDDKRANDEQDSDEEWDDDDDFDNDQSGEDEDSK